MNFFPATLADGTLAAGPFRIPLDADIATRLARPGELQAAIRPEDVTTETGFDDPDVFGGVEHVLKLGAIRLAVIDVGDGQRLKVQDMGRTPLAAGKTVGVHAGRLLVYRNGIEPIEVVRARAAASTRRFDLPLAVGSR